MSDTPDAEVVYARYAGFWAKLDCEACGAETEVEGDVSNGEKIQCDGCGQEVEVYNR